MYHEVDIPSPVHVSIESLVDHLRAMSTCFSIDLLSACQAIWLLTGQPLSVVPSYVTGIIRGTFEA